MNGSPTPVQWPVVPIHSRTVVTSTTVYRSPSDSFPRWGTHGVILKLEVLVKDVLGLDIARGVCMAWATLRWGPG